MRPPRALAAALLAAPLAAAPLAAQGTVSAQGLGYPPGQLSTMARGTGGAFGDVDPSSPINPAAMAVVPSTSVFAHYAPESRRITFGDARDDARVVRFPVIGAVLTVGQRMAFGVSSSTLLDRTWQTTSGDVSDPEAVLESFESRGAINDVRVAGSYTVSPRLHAGLGLHLLAGNNRLSVSRVDQSGEESNFTQTREIGFTGTAASAGLIWNAGRQIALSASGQVGGAVRAKQGDSTIAEGSAPARASASVRYSGLTGAVLAARFAWDGWSSLADLGTERLGAQDATEIGVGADIVGPRFLGRSLALRVGARWRELPFATLGEQPTEQGFSGGLGFSLGGNRALVDLSLERARRSAGQARETAWIFGAGLTVRP